MTSVSVEAFRGWSVGPEFWSSVTGLLSVVVGLVGMLFSVRGMIKSSVRKRESVEQAIADMLTKRDWFLVFNPKPPGRGKALTFLDNEEIGEGKNDNDSKWRVRRGLLELLNSDGKVFSRFVYDKDKQIFFHTNDEDTLSLRSQRIEPLSRQAEFDGKGVGVTS